MSNHNLSIGLFGFGCVGQGLYDILNHAQGLPARIGKICVKDHFKKRSIDLSNFTFDRNEVLQRDDLNVVVELINDSDDALDIVTRALKSQKSVVTANKKLLAEHFGTLYNLQRETGASLIYEGACGGSIPIIRNLEEYYDNELLCSLRAIVNGSCNYILTSMERDELTFGEALLKAQQLGFAEADPWLDVAGYDTKYKLCLLSIHSFGLLLKPEKILNLGIQNISAFDIAYARSRGLRIKLVAHAQKVGDKFRLYAIPHFIARDSKLYDVNYEYNAIEVEGAFSDKQFFVGKGAGSYPTGSAVLSDISALRYGYKYEYKKLEKQFQLGGAAPEEKLDTDFLLKVYIRYSDKAEIEPLAINRTYEEYRSEENSYIIADVEFSSLMSLSQDVAQKLFVCVVE